MSSPYQSRSDPPATVALHDTQLLGEFFVVRPMNICPYGTRPFGVPTALHAATNRGNTSACSRRICCDVGFPELPGFSESPSCHSDWKMLPGLAFHFFWLETPHWVIAASYIPASVLSMFGFQDRTEKSAAAGTLIPSFQDVGIRVGP